MALLVLKICVDVCWYLAVMCPIIAALPLPLAAVFYALPAVYALALLFKQIDFSAFLPNQDIFLWECKLLLLAAALEIGFAGASNWENRSAMWVFLFLSLGVLLLRMSRLGDKYQKDKRFWMWNGIYVVAVLLLALAGTSDAMLHSVVWLVKSAYMNLIVPILLGILYLFSSILEVLVSGLMSLFPEWELKTRIQEFTVDPLAEQLKDVEEKDIPYQFKWIMVVIIVIIAAVVIWQIYKKLTDTTESNPEKTLGMMTKSRIAKKDRKTGPGKDREDKQEHTVRVLYQKFLKLCVKNGIEITPAESSLEIQEKASSVWETEEIRPLRRIYIKARYSGKNVSEAEMESAKEEYRKIKKSSPK